MIALSLATISEIMSVCLFFHPFDLDKAQGKHKECYKQFRAACDHATDPHKCVEKWVSERLEEKLEEN